MANPNVFAQYVAPVRSFTDYTQQLQQIDNQRLLGANLQQENAIKAAALVTAQRNAQLQARKDNAIASLVSQTAGNEDAYVSGLQKLGFFDEAQKLQKERGEVAKAGAETQAKALETKRKAFEYVIQGLQMANDPQTAAQMVSGAVAQGAMSMQQAQQFAAGIPQDPAQFAQWRAGTLRSILAAKDQLPKLEARDGGGANNFYSTDAVTGVSTLTRSDTKTMTPAERDAADRGWATINDARKERDKPTWDPTNQVWVNRATQTVTPGAGPDGKPMAGKATNATEDERKAAGWLAQADNAWKNMREVAFDANGNIKPAAQPGLNDAIAAIPSLGLGESIANSMRRPDRQKFIQASSSLSEALLRAATGAGVNESEAKQKIAELTPVFGESDETTKQKMAAIPMYLESLRTRAGRAAPSGYVVPPVPGAQGGPTIDPKKLMQEADRIIGL